MPKYESPYAKPAAKPVAVKPVRPLKPAAPSPSLLGTGMAAKAGAALKGRKAKLDEAIRKAGG